MLLEIVMVEMKLAENMSNSMRIKQQTPSVVARLMGLDELPPQQHIHKQRVLSEDYLRKSASIGLREKRRLSRMNKQKQPEFKDIHCIQSIPAEKESLSAKKKSRTFEKQIFANAKHVGIDGKILDSMEFNKVMENKHTEKNGKRWKLEKTSRRNVLRNLNHKLGEHGLGSKVGTNGKNSVLSSPLGINSKDCMKNDFVTKLSRFKSVPAFSRAIGNPKSSSYVPYSKSNFNYRVQEARVIQDEVDNNFEKIVLKAYGSMIADVVEATLDVEFSYKELKEQQSEQTPYKSIVKDGISSSHGLNTSVGQESSIGSSLEDGLIFLNCSKIDSDFSVSLGDAYQPSPNSVLELPFGEEILSDFESYESVTANLHELWTQLQLLKSECEETHSEGPGMTVSSDEGSRVESVDYSKGKGKLMGEFRAEESRDFSYVVDVLDEINFDCSHSAECAVDPTVFEKLEKKYGEQTSWKKSERKLLFDRMNSGLMEILQPYIEVHKWENPLRKRISTRARKDLVEEELWVLLINHEKEVNKSLSEKVLGGDTKWLELGDDIDIIVSEIQIFLFDELVAELGEI